MPKKIKLVPTVGRLSSLREVQVSWWWRDKSLIPLGILDVDGREQNKRRFPDTFLPYQTEKYSAIAYETCARWSGNGDDYYWPPRYPLNFPWIQLDPFLRARICRLIWPTPMAGAILVTQPLLPNSQSLLEDFLVRAALPAAVSHHDKTHDALRLTLDVNLRQSNRRILRDLESIIQDLRKYKGIPSRAGHLARNRLQFRGLESLSKRAAGLTISSNEYFSLNRQKFTFGQAVQTGWENFSTFKYKASCPFRGFLADPVGSNPHQTTSPPKIYTGIRAANQREACNQALQRLIGLRIIRRNFQMQVRAKMVRMQGK